MDSAGRRAAESVRLGVAGHRAVEERPHAPEMGALLADLVILDRSPLTVDTLSIKDIRGVDTIKEGRDDLQGP